MEPSFLWGVIFSRSHCAAADLIISFFAASVPEQLRLAIFSGLGFAVAQAHSLGVMRLQVLSAGAAMRMLPGPVPVQ